MTAAYQFVSIQVRVRVWVWVRIGFYHFFFPQVQHGLAEAGAKPYLVIAEI